MQGDLIGNLFRRDHEPDHKRGAGIGVEAGRIRVAISGNVIA